MAKTISLNKESYTWLKVLINKPSYVKGKLYDIANIRRQKFNNKKVEIILFL